MGIANCLIATGRDRSAWPGYTDFAKFVQTTYPLEKVSAATGVSEEMIKGLARELMRAGRPLVLSAAGSGQGLGAFEAGVGMCLNVLLERINVAGDVHLKVI